MVRGEIRWYTFKSPDKRRPVLILTRTSAIEYLNEVTVASATSVIRDIPSEVFLSKLDGMPKDCVLNFDRIHTVPKSSIGSLITSLSHQKMAEVRDAVSFTLGL
ncbi:MAG: type II toxin-antitoxin system PemK/MazF family toxin [Lentisphaeraceae bacterium]|nr:type II toxin-antitoxin system PemK/MazF family toxin [Lentisphaeraceae bacterium]